MTEYLTSIVADTIKIAYPNLSSTQVSGTEMQLIFSEKETEIVGSRLETGSTAELTIYNARRRSSGTLGLEHLHGAAHQLDTLLRGKSKHDATYDAIFINLVSAALRMGVIHLTDFDFIRSCSTYESKLYDRIAVPYEQNRNRIPYKENRRLISVFEPILIPLPSAYRCNPIAGCKFREVSAATAEKDAAEFVKNGVPAANIVIGPASRYTVRPQLTALIHGGAYQISDFITRTGFRQIRDIPYWEKRIPGVTRSKDILLIELTSGTPARNPESGWKPAEAKVEMRVSGDTYPLRLALKDAGFRYDGKRRLWRRAATAPAEQERIITKLLK